MKKNGREPADVMDLDEVYYDAGTCGYSYRENSAMLVKKRSSENEVTGYGELAQKRNGKVDLLRCFVAVIKRYVKLFK